MKRLARLLAEQQAKGHVEDSSQSLQARPGQLDTAQIKTSNLPMVVATDQKSEAQGRRGRRISSEAAGNDGTT
jgi:hypothetical protein